MITVVNRWKVSHIASPAFWETMVSKKILGATPLDQNITSYSTVLSLLGQKRTKNELFLLTMITP